MHASRSLRTRFVVFLVLILFVAQGIGTFLFIRYTRNSLLDSLGMRATMTARMLAGVSMAPLLSYDYAMIDSYLDEAMKDDELVAVRILDKDRKVARERKRDAGGAEVRDLTMPVKVGDETVGFVSIGYTAKGVEASMRKSMTVIPLYQGVVLLLLAAGVMLLFNRSVKQPIADINDAIDRVTEGDLALDVPKHGDDEIGTIADGVNFLVHRLDGMVVKIRSISSNVSTAASRLNGSIEKVAAVAEVQHRTMESTGASLRQLADARRQIIENTEKLLELSNESVTALIQTSTTTELIAKKVETLDDDVAGSYATSTQLSQSAQHVAEMARIVMEDVEGATKSVENLFAAITEIENSVREAVMLSKQTTTEISEKGLTAVSDAHAGMKTIGTFIDTLLGTVERFSNRSRDIEKILVVIDEVTEQTRLLSLNAQIIASQAGESGRSFTVVSNEMRELSEKTASSTKEIENIVATFKREIGDVVSQARETVKKVHEGDQVIMRMDSVLDGIYDASQKTTQIASVIEAASHSQTAGLRQIVTALDDTRKHMHEVSTATAEQGVGAAEMLRSIASVKEASEFTKKATEDQVNAIRLITENIERSNRMTEEIATASYEQQSVNRQVADAFVSITQESDEAVSEIARTAELVTALNDDAASLMKEIAFFATKDPGTPAGS